jgi:hypothetical protein
MRVKSANASSSIEAALSTVPAQFKTRLLERYRGLKSAFLEGKHDLCGLRAGRFCEVLLRLLQERLTGTHIPFGTKVQNYDEECRKLESIPRATGPESLRVVIPRALSFLYTLRNKRGIGHEGGDVDANQIDSAVCVKIADWCLSELIRVVHSLSMEEAQSIVDVIATKQLPAVWTVGNKKRVLDTSLDYPSQTLLLLGSDSRAAVPLRDLFEWTGHSNLAVYKRDVIRLLHKRRFLDCDETTGMVVLSPSGAIEVEERILPRVRLKFGH